MENRFAHLKRVLSLLMVFAMLAAFLPITVSATVGPQSGVWDQAAPTYTADGVSCGTNQGSSSFCRRRI